MMAPKDVNGTEIHEGDIVAMFFRVVETYPGDGLYNMTLVSCEPGPTGVHRYIYAHSRQVDAGEVDENQRYALKPAV